MECGGMRIRGKANLPLCCSIVALALLSACSQRTPSGSPAAPARVRQSPRMLHAPLFPARRIVAFYGEAGVPSMGVLGSDTPEAVALRLTRQAQGYAGFGRPVTPAFEEIAVAAQRAPGARGVYHSEPDLSGARRYLLAARKISALFVIDIQPGRERFLPLVRRFEGLLREPDVGLALDPEWEMRAGEVPGETIGGTTANEVNAVATYLAGIVRRYRLPQKLFVIHQFLPDMIARRSAVRSLPELATTYHVDGFGYRAIKLLKYRTLATRDHHFHNGLKLFYDQDVNMLTPASVMQLRPQPDFITYQ